MCQSGPEYPQQPDRHILGVPPLPGKTRSSGKYIATLDPSLADWDALWDHVERYTINGMLPIQFVAGERYMSLLQKTQESQPVIAGEDFVEPPLAHAVALPVHVDLPLACQR